MFESIKECIIKDEEIIEIIFSLNDNIQSSNKSGDPITLSKYIEIMKYFISFIKLVRDGVVKDNDIPLASDYLDKIQTQREMHMHKKRDLIVHDALGELLYKYKRELSINESL